MTLTAKQRAKIYRRAAEEINTGGACCMVMAKIHYNQMRHYPDVYELMRLYPEFAAHSPNKRKVDTGLWWPLDQRTPRILALLFSEQMALDSIKTKK